MKKGIIFAVVACAMALCFALIGCGGNTADYDKNFIGKWEVESMTSDGEELDADTMDFMRALGMNVVFDLKEGGNGNLDLMGEQLDFTWKAKDASTVTITAEGDSADFKLQDSKLVGEFDDASMTLVKNDDAQGSTSSE